MFLRALVAFLVLPGVFAIALPPLIASVDPWRGERVCGGAAVLALGAVVVGWCIRDFYVAGKGTLAPWDPPRRLVVVGLYRYVRNPMYVGVLVAVAGWALVGGSPAVAAYAVALAIAFHVRVVVHEEPWLARRFPSAWPAYASSVRRWLPRATPAALGSPPASPPAGVETPPGSVVTARDGDAETGR
jgi:protein-S-isoprenylcysteine O-methyltransferase Ste14